MGPAPSRPSPPPSDAPGPSPDPHLSQPLSASSSASTSVVAIEGPYRLPRTNSWLDGGAIGYGSSVAGTSRVGSQDPYALQMASVGQGAGWPPRRPLSSLSASASVGGGTAAPVTTAAAAARKQTMEKEVPSNSLKGSFVKDLIPMMIGFGDDDNPSMDTVDFVEDAVVAYSVQVLTSALHLAKQRGRVKASTGKPMGPPTAEDVMTVVRKDSRKVRRVEELLIMQKEIKIIQDMEKTDEEALAQQFS